MGNQLFQEIFRERLHKGEIVYTVDSFGNEPLEVKKARYCGPAGKYDPYVEIIDSQDPLERGVSIVKSPLALFTPIEVEAAIQQHDPSLLDGNPPLEYLMSDPISHRDLVAVLCISAMRRIADD